MNNRQRSRREAALPKSEDIAPRNVSRITQGVFLLACLAFMLLWAHAMPKGVEWVKAATDTCTGIMRFRILLSPLLVFPLVMLFFSALDGLRCLQYRQWPWPGMWLWKDTPIRSARYALWRGRLLLILAVPVLLALTSYMTWLLLFGELLSPDVHAQCASLP
ncbi:hypothetical protein CO610_05590 [Lysobacteraceae bacterium NML95-0200]|nr:hypothetical protein CO610_05590 [Xanthomonadaceae bacterium NML95-0200]